MPYTWPRRASGSWSATAPFAGTSTSSTRACPSTICPTTSSSRTREPGASRDDVSSVVHGGEFTLARGARCAYRVGCLNGGRGKSRWGTCHPPDARADVAVAADRPSRRPRPRCRVRAGSGRREPGPTSSRSLRPPVPIHRRPDPVRSTLNINSDQGRDQHGPMAPFAL